MVAGTGDRLDATLVVTFAEKKRARDVPLYCRRALADLLASLLCDQAVRRIHASTRRWDRGRTRSGKFRGSTAYIEYENGVKDWWAADLPGLPAAAYNFRHRALMNSIATATSRSKASPEKNYLFREEFTLGAIWATRYDFPAVKDGARVKLENPAGSTAVGWAGLVHQHPPRQVQGLAGCAKPLGLRVRFRVDPTRR